MSNNEQPKNLPIEILLEEKKKIVVFNSEHQNILEHISSELKADKYNSIVTMDNFNSMKESSNELGKMSKLISRFRIDKKNSEMEDINTFDTNFKSYCSLIDEKQTEIKKGLDVFEAETRKQILEVCQKYLVEQYKEQDLRVEFRTIDISDMTLSKYATKNMAISKNGKDEIDKRINEKVSLQNKVDNRILSLENICLKAGIEPLTVEHIQGFLFEADEKYEIKLKLLIDAEIKRNEAVKARVEAETRKAVTEEAKQEQVQNTTPFEEEAKEPVKEVEQPIKKEMPVGTDGKVEKTLSIKIRVPESASDAQIIGAVINMIKADKFPIENIEVN